ncbi:MAG: DUF2817 domain-containing protein [Myxococcota bacterium]
MAGRDFFSPDYLESRRRFLELAEGLGAEMESHPLRSNGPDGAPLTIDVAWFGSRKAERIVVVTSATHGVEGFMGAAVQQHLLSDLPELDEGVAFVLVHAINPYGYAFVRRVNEDNVDLNRNFLREGESYTGAPEGYAELDGMLNPRKPPSRWTPKTFPLRAIPQIARHGLGTVKSIVAGGQYAFPKGVFFGGAAKSNTMEILEAQIPRWFGHARHVLVVDFHTGLGTPGTYKLLIDHAPDTQRTAWLAEQFGDVVQPWDAGEGVAYQIRGGFGTWVKSLLPEVEIDVLCAEFGSVHVLKVITALTAENRAHQWGRPDDPTTKMAKSLLMEAFAPSDPSWRDTVVERGRRIVEQALAAV